MENCRLSAKVLNSLKEVGKWPLAEERWNNWWKWISKCSVNSTKTTEEDVVKHWTKKKQESVRLHNNMLALWTRACGIKNARHVSGSFFFFIPAWYISITMRWREHLAITSYINSSLVYMLGTRVHDSPGSLWWWMMIADGTCWTAWLLYTVGRRSCHF